MSGHRVYYNEIEPYCVQWLRNLIDAELLPAGDVDERSIEDVTEGDLSGYRQAHFFCGIGGWPLALGWAGWPPEREVWTGSCPCQPISVAGVQAAERDARHLWPAFYRLIEKRKPSVIFGEQVAGSVGLEWLAALRLDVETLGYACAGADISAAGAGAPHIRQRLYWVAEDERMADGNGFGWSDAAKDKRAKEPGGSGNHCNRLGDSDWARLEGLPQHENRGSQFRGCQKKQNGSIATAGIWNDPAWVYCKDRKIRPTKPGVLPVAARLPGFVDSIRSFGNAIVPKLATDFIGAYMDCRP